MEKKDVIDDNVGIENEVFNNEINNEEVVVQGTEDIQLQCEDNDSDIKGDIEKITKEDTKEGIKEDAKEDTKEKQNKTTTKELTKTEYILKEIRSYVCIVIAAVLVAVVVNTYILSNTRIPTGSMENTIMCGNRLFGNRLAYKFSDVQRGDVIIFKYPDDKSINYIKRVIGLPGETVNIVDGVVYINDVKLEENYLKEPMLGDFGPYKVPEKSYFVMGDNRNNSNDARLWQNTYLKEEDIIAKAVIRYWPSLKIIK